MQRVAIKRNVSEHLEGGCGGDQAAQPSPDIHLACQDAAQVAEEGDVGQQQLPQDQQRPGVVLRRHIEKAEYRSLGGPTDLRLHNNQGKDHTRETDGTAGGAAWDQPAS